MPTNFDLSQVDEGEVEATDLFAVEDESSSTTRARKAGQLMLLTDKETDGNEAVIQMGNPDLDAGIDQAIATREAEVFQQLNSLLQERLEQDPASFDQTVEDVSGIIQDRERKSRSSISRETALAEKLAREAEEPVPDAVDEQAARIAGANLLRDLLDKQGVTDTVFDFGGLLWPFGFTTDLADISGEKLDWTNAVDVEQLLIDYQALDPAKKKAVQPALLDVILEATGTTVLGVEVSEQNVLKAAGIFSRFLEAEGEGAIKAERVADIIFSFADVGGVGVAKGLIGTAVNIADKTTNGAKIAAAVGNKAKAADITIAAAKDEAVARASGLDRVTAAMNALPLDRSATNKGQVPGLQPEIVTRLNEFQRQTEQLTRNILADQDLLRVGALNRFEKENFIKSWEQGLETRVSDTFNDDVYVTNMRATNVTDEGFTAEYDLVRNDKTFLRTKEKVLFTTDKNGNFNYTTIASTEAERALGSPAFWSRTIKDGADFNDSFKSAGVTTDAAAGFQQRLETMVKEAFEPVAGFGKKGLRKDVEAVLLKGDEHINESGLRGTVYTPFELATGIDTGSRIVRITDPDAVEAYYRMRSVADKFWLLENHAAKRRLELNGFQKSIQLGEDGQPAVRVIETAARAKQSFRNRSSRTGSAAYDEVSNEVLELSEELIDAQYAKGKVLTRTSTDQPIKKVDGTVEHVDYVFTYPDRLSPLPQQVIHYKRGYIPKINKDVEYLVKEEIPFFKRGVENATTAKTLRFFASKKDAERFAEEMAQKAVNEGRYPDLETAMQKFSAVPDRELTPMQRVHESLGPSGGLYTGARSSEDILTGLRGRETARVGVYEAMSRNARHLGSLVARNEARVGDEQRWLNTVDSLRVARNEGFEGTKLPDDRLGSALSTERKLIQQWNGVPQIDETAWQGVMQHLHDWMLEGARRFPGLQNKDSIKSLQWLKHTDLASAMKATTMHAVLGVLNPAQLLVQASAMSVAITRYPRHGLAMLNYGFRMGMADGIRNPTTLEKASKHFMRVDDTTPLFDELYDAWKRSGLRESVRTNADLETADRYGFVTAEALKRLSDTSLLFYRQGELMNRRAAFITSYLEWKRLHPGLKPSKDDLLDIRKDANLTMLELNAANRAMWQGGPNTGTIRQILGVMTQFQQVAAKSLELAFKGTARGGFDNGTKMRILAGQFAFFGLAGVPLFGSIAGEAAKWLDADMDQETINRWNQGLFIGALLNALGADVDLANRTAAFGQVNQFIKDMLFDDQPLIVKMFGVAGDVGSRAWQTVQKLKPLSMAVYQSGELTRTDLAVAMQELSQIPSSSRNLVKAWVMHNAHVIRDRHGNVVDRANYNFATELAVGIGFRSSVEAETRIMQMSNKDEQDFGTQVADVYVGLAHRYTDALLNGDSSQQNEAAMRLQSVMKLLATTMVDKPHIYKKVSNAIQDKLANPKTIRERELKRFLERQIPGELWENAQADRRTLLGQAGSDTAIVRPFQRELERRGEE
jgi:hypothetical protein